MLIRVALALLAVTVPALADPIAGRATVIDGDTIEVHGTRIRLYGIDAPESAQACQDGSGQDYRCGQAAALALADRIGAAPVSCEPRDIDRYGRTVAVCALAGTDLNGWLVEQGLAVAYRHYSDAYGPAEDRARQAKRGLWAGTFTMPWTWRHDGAKSIAIRRRIKS